MKRGLTAFEKKVDKNYCKQVKVHIEEAKVLIGQQCHNESDTTACLQAKKDYTTLLSKFKSNQCENYYPFENERKVEKNSCKQVKVHIEKAKILVGEQCHKESDPTACLEAKKAHTDLLSSFKSNQCENYYPFENGKRCTNLLGIMYYSNRNLENRIKNHGEYGGSLKDWISDYEETISDFEQSDCSNTYRWK